MVRQHTLLSQRLLPQSPRYHRPQLPSSRPAHTFKSPLATKPHFQKHPKVSPWAENRRTRLPRPALPTILEEEEEEHHPLRQNFDIHRQLDMYGHEEKHDNYGEDEYGMDWDAETTLVALFQDDVTEADDEEDLAALADKLKAPMSAQSQQLKQYIADTVIPVVKRVKQVHDTLEDEVDMTFGTGLLAFDEVCKRVETMALQTEDQAKTVYLESQKHMRALMGELAEAYRRREQLWIDLEAKLGDRAERAKAALEAIPSDVEDTIVRLEKKCKDMEKNSNSVASKQKMLKDLLEQL